MTIKEYASEMGFTVQEVLNKCRDLGYKATDGNPFPPFGTSLQENSRLSFGHLSANGLLQGSGSQTQSAIGRSDEGSERLS